MRTIDERLRLETILPVALEHFFTGQKKFEGVVVVDGAIHAAILVRQTFLAHAIVQLGEPTIVKAKLENEIHLGNIEK